MEDFLKKYFYDNLSYFNNYDFNANEMFLIISKDKFIKKEIKEKDLFELLKLSDDKLKKLINKYLNQEKVDLDTYLLLDLNLKKYQVVNFNDQMFKTYLIGDSKEIKPLRNYQGYVGGIYLKGPFYRIGGCGNFIIESYHIITSFKDLIIKDSTNLSNDDLEFVKACKFLANE